MKAELELNLKKCRKYCEVKLEDTIRRKEHDAASMEYAEEFPEFWEGRIAQIKSTLAVIKTLGGK